MSFNLKRKCDEAADKEFFYGAKVNHDIKDAYMGLCFLDPEESERKAGPGKGHEEILYLVEGQIEINLAGKKNVLNQGDVFYIPDGKKVILTNLTANRVYFMIAGGHTKVHSHRH